MPQTWEVLGGADKGGIVVRAGKELTSPALLQRLATGSVLEEIAAVDNRLHFRRLAGTGPDEGWVSIAISGKRLVARAEEAFAGAWEDDEGTEVVIEGLTMHGLGTSLPLEVSGVRMCSFRMNGEVFQGRLLGDGRLLWSDGALWCRKKVEGGLVRTDDAPTAEAPKRATKAMPKPTVSSDVPLGPRGADGRRPLPERPLSPKEIVDWIAEAIDVFETMLLPLEAVSESQARQQYKQLLLLVHPDKNSQEGATDAFRKLFDAFAVVVDPAAQRRALSRAQGRSGHRGGGFGAQGDGGNSWSFPGFGFFDEYGGGVGSMVAAVFAQDNVDDSERVLLQHSDMLEAMGKYDGSDKTWVNPEKAKELWDADMAHFVDVRDGDEFDTSCITNALNVNWAMVGFAKNSEEVKEMQKDSSKMVIVYSDNGSQISRCGQVAAVLGRFLPSHQVRRLRRGLNAWKRLGYPVEGSRHTFFARQRLGDNVLKLGDSGLELEEGQKSLPGIRAKA